MQGHVDTSIFVVAENAFSTISDVLLVDLVGKWCGLCSNRGQQISIAVHLKIVREAT
jgi:hypothetical protein